MKPSKRAILVHTATIYNVYKDPVTGKLGYWRSFLEYTRLMDRASTVNVSGIGWTQVVTQQWLVDPDLTVAYDRDGNGNQVTKVYADSDSWAALAADQKQAYWTMKEGDYVTAGECSVLIPPDAMSDLTALKPRKIGSILSILNKSGDIELWEVGLV